VPNIKTAYWLQNNVDFDQLIMEFYDKDDPAGGWVHISYHESGSNRKQVLTFDGKKYTEGLPDMEWKGGKVVGYLLIHSIQSPIIPKIIYRMMRICSDNTS